MLDVSKFGHLDIRKVLEKRMNAADGLSKLKLKIHGDTNAHQGEFGSIQKAVVRGHHHIKSTPRSNILYTARMIQAKDA